MKSATTPLVFGRARGESVDLSYSEAFDRDTLSVWRGYISYAAKDLFKCAVGPQNREDASTGKKRREYMRDSLHVAAHRLYA